MPEICLLLSLYILLYNLIDYIYTAHKTHVQLNGSNSCGFNVRNGVKQGGVLSPVLFCIYEGRSINKLQNGAILLIIKIEKIRNIRFVGNLILKIHRNFLDDDVIIVTSSVHRTQSICVLFSPPVFYHNSQVINSIGTRKNE